MSAAALNVLLTPRAPGGHETALFGWLHDAVRLQGLQPRLLGLDARLAAAARAAGLAPDVVLRSDAHVDTDAAARTPLRHTLATLAQLGRPCGAQSQSMPPLLLAPGVLHAQAWLLAAALARGHAVWLYVPMTYSAVTMGYRGGALRDALLAPLLRRVAGVITIDQRQQQLLQQRWRIGVPVHVLPNQVALHAAALPPPVSAPQLRVAFVGRFDPWQKGLDWLAAQLAAAAPWTLGCRWLFQGAGAAEARLLQLASALGPHRVQVRPFAPIDAALADADVLLLPSRYEGLPLVALEASVRGRAVVASQHAGLQGLLPATSLFDFGDAAGLARALASLATPAARQAAVQHAQARLPALLQRCRYESALHALVQGWQAPTAPASARA